MKQFVQKQCCEDMNPLEVWLNANFPRDLYIKYGLELSRKGILQIRTSFIN